MKDRRRKKDLLKFAIEPQKMEGSGSEYHKESIKLILTSKWVIQFHSELFKPYELTVQQYNILRILRGQHPTATSVKKIQERMLDRLSDSSRIVELLRKKKFIERAVNKIDRRMRDVLISDKGLHLLDKIDADVNQRMDNYLKNLDEMEIDRLNFLLDKLR